MNFTRFGHFMFLKREKLDFESVLARGGHMADSD
jgi:hypothetical protein